MPNDDYNIDRTFNEAAAEVIKTYRKMKQLSLEEVVKKMKNPVTRQSLYKYENNQARMKNSIFLDICGALNLEPEKAYMRINEFASRIEDKQQNNLTKKNDELAVLFDKNKDILSDSDKAVIKTIIEERRKAIDKELGENEI